MNKSLKDFINKENIKQIMLIALAIVFMGIGFLNLNIDKPMDEIASIEVASRNVAEESLGDVELVSSQAIVENDSLEMENINEDKNYFEETKIERDKMYSETIETYERLIEKEETPEDQKAIITEEISRITNMKNGIIISENLIKNKGIEDVVILENNGVVNVIVKTVQLNEDKVSQIQNIILKELKVDIGNLSISRK